MSADEDAGGANGDAASSTRMASSFTKGERYHARSDVESHASASARKALQQASIPSSVTELGDWAFWGCRNLPEVQLHEGLEIIGKGTFEGCRALQRVIIPSSVTKLGSCAFDGCRNLAEVRFNEGLEIIGGDAFHICDALQQMTIPSSVTKLGNWAFQGCSSLTKVQ
ncbi:hypothetical protein THAOC_15030, partial [Thalassiosira oceanica]